MKKVFMISMITFLLIVIVSSLTGCASRDAGLSEATSAASTGTSETTGTRIYGTPFHICPDTPDVRTYETDSVRVDAVDGIIDAVGTTMVSVTLTMDEITEYVLKQEAYITDGYVCITLVTSDQLVKSDGKVKPELVGAYDEVVSQLRQKGIDGTVCITLYEVDEFTMDYIRVTRGW